MCSSNQSRVKKTKKVSAQVTEITDSVAVSKKVPLVDIFCAKSTRDFPIQIKERLKGKVEEDKMGWNGKQRKRREKDMY